MSTIVDDAPVVLDDPPPVVLVDDRPRRPRSVSRTDLAEYAVSLVSGMVAAALLCVLFDWRHALTFALLTAVAALTVEWLLVRDRAGAVLASDRVVTALVWSSAATAVGILGWMIAFVAIKGVPGLDWEFFSTDMSKVGPLNPGGGAFHAIVGTLEQTAIATVVSVPLGILTAVYLHEIGGRMSWLVRFVSDALSGLPSIVAGLLVYTFWVSTGHGFTGVGASMAFVVVMLPIITRTAEEILRTVNPGLRESALALGSPQWRVVAKIVLPTARAGLVTAAILGVARVVGETAPALLTALGSASTNYNPLDGQQSDLPLFVWGLLRQPNEVQVQRAWSGALVLIALVLLLFTLARVISARATRRLGGNR